MKNLTLSANQNYKNVLLPITLTLQKVLQTYGKEK